MRGFPVSKFQDRLIQAQPLMADAGLNELFLTSEASALPLSSVAPRNLQTI
tara:strand:+ start:1670 stop:1822 length:153 start_codon:yes stop_codon:yes gene_type:complete